MFLHFRAVLQHFVHTADGADDVAGEEVLPDHVLHLGQLALDLLDLLALALALDELVARDHLQEATLSVADLRT